jgi:hypothetical protein
VTEMTEFLMRFYAMSEEDAREVIAELKDRRSLEILAGYRVAARAVPAPHRPNL